MIFPWLAPERVSDHVSRKQARTALERLRLPRTRDDALRRLARWQGSFTLLELYQANFPTDFAASTAPLLAEPDEPFGPREREFFDLIERHRFYFNQDWYLETSQDDWGLAFPVPPIGIAICTCSDTFDEQDLGWQLLILLLGLTNATTADLPLSADIQAALAPILEAPLPSGRLDWEVFTNACRAQPHLGQRLITTIEVLDHDTGNIFLDQHCCQETVDAYWNQEWIDRLTLAFTEAEALMADATALTEWLAADPLPRMQEVQTLWYRSYRPQN